MTAAPVTSGSALDGVLSRVRRALRPGVTHVVPLGLSCRVTHQARTCFGVSEAYPFDWWLSPLAGLTHYLRRLEPQRIYGPGGLREEIVDGRIHMIRSVDFGFDLGHDFPRSGTAGAGGLPGVVPEWRDHLTAARERHERRLRRLRRLDRPGNRILFLRHKYSVDPREAAPAAEVAALWDALHRLCLQATVDLLLLNVPVDGRLPRGVLSVRFDDPPAPPPHEWRGESPRWQAAFAVHGIHLRRDAASRARAAGPLSTEPPN